MPMSTPPATPTKPPAAPPATVNDLKLSTAATLTDPPSESAVAPSPTKACVVTWSSVTPTPPAMPTKPPPALADSPKTFSLDALCTARPSKLAVSKPPEPVKLPSYTPLIAAPAAWASTLLPEPMNASVSFVTEATPTATPMPT